MRIGTAGWMAGALGLALAACGGGETTADEGETPEAAAAESAVPATSSTAATDGPDAAAASPAASAKPANDLTAYIGKFPFDEVGGVKWDDHPTVTAGIRKTVTDAAVRKAIEDTSGPSAPIATYQGKVGSWACEQHNCGDHQWTVLVDPSSGATDVCYHDAAKMGENSRWFLAGGKQETRPGNCAVV